MRFVAGAGAASAATDNGAGCVSAAKEPNAGGDSHRGRGVDGASISDIEADMDISPKQVKKRKSEELGDLRRWARTRSLVCFPSLFLLCFVVVPFLSPRTHVPTSRHL